MDKSEIIKLYNKICEMEKTYPEGHQQIEFIKKQKEELILKNKELFNLDFQK